MSISRIGEEVESSESSENVVALVVIDVCVSVRVPCASYTIFSSIDLSYSQQNE